MSPGWWNGRHGGFKILCPNGRAGSSPAPGTQLLTCFAGHGRPRKPILLYVKPEDNLDPYKSPSDAELFLTPHAFADKLYEDQTVLVTGGAGGIGRAICILLGRLGARVVTCGRDSEKLDKLKVSLGEHGIDCRSMVMNLRDPDAVAALIEFARNETGRLDLVCNNAGGQFPKDAAEITPKGWAAVLETNLYSQWYMMQAAANSWIREEVAGSIVNIGTVTGKASVGLPHTAAARAGAVGLATSLSVEWAPHSIRVNTVAVGVVRSPGLVNYPPEARPSFDHNAQRRLGEVHDVAQAVAFLGSPVASGYITGDVVNVAGGEQAWGEYWALGKPDFFKIKE